MVTELSRRTGFSGPALVRLVSQLAQVAVTEPRQSPAARLDEWLGWTESILLSKVLSSVATSVSAARRDNTADIVDVAELANAEFNQLCTVLEQAVAAAAAPPSLAPGLQRRQLRSANKPVGDVDFPSYRRRYSMLQQKMESSIATLRGRLRSMLAAQSPDMARLAALDAAMEQALVGHELRLLAGVPAMLEAHFERLKIRASSITKAGVEAAGRASTLDAEQSSAVISKAEGPHPEHAKLPQESDHAVNQDAELQQGPGLGQGTDALNWLDTFRHDMGRVMQAELSLRLQPIQGLLSAISIEQNKL